MSHLTQDQHCFEVISESGEQEGLTLFNF